MEAKAFFNALPFVKVQDGLTWPLTAKQGNLPLIVRHLKLSVEALSLEDNESLVVPVYLSNLGDDPCCCEVDIAFVASNKTNLTQTGVTSPGSVSTSLSTSQSPAYTPRRQGGAFDSANVDILLRINNDFVLLVEVGCIQSLDLKGGEQEQQQLPPSLTICFESCAFRLYGQNGSDTCHSLQIVLDNLTKITRLTPTTCETAQSGENACSETCGQKEMPMPRSHEEEEEEAVTETPVKSTRKAAPAASTESPAVGIKRKRQALDESFELLQKVNQCFERPAVAANPVETIAPLMTSAAQELSQGYSLPSVVAAYSESLEQQQAQQDQQLDDLMQSVFPPPRRGGGGSPSRSPPPQNHVESAQEAVQEILTKQQELIRERHRLALLPTRN